MSTAKPPVAIIEVLQRTARGLKPIDTIVLREFGAYAIGRAPDNNICLESASVSNHHAWLEISRAGMRVGDRGSATGTFLDEEGVMVATSWDGKAHFRVGYFEFRLTEVSGHKGRELREFSDVAPKPMIKPRTAAPSNTVVEVLQRTPEGLKPIDTAVVSEFGAYAIGRAHDNDIRIDSASIANYHAWLEMTGTGMRVADRGSATGTFLNEDRVTAATSWDGQQQFRVGDFELRLVAIQDNHDRQADSVPGKYYKPLPIPAADISEDGRSQLIDLNSDPNPRVWIVIREIGHKDGGPNEIRRSDAEAKEAVTSTIIPPKT